MFRPTALPSLVTTPFPQYAALTIKSAGSDGDTPLQEDHKHLEQFSVSSSFSVEGIVADDIGSSTTWPFRRFHEHDHLRSSTYSIPQITSTRDAYNLRLLERIYGVRGGLRGDDDDFFDLRPQVSLQPATILYTPR